MTLTVYGRLIFNQPNMQLLETPPVLHIGTITIIGAAEIAAFRARMQALFGERT